jgi:hypothetical protein
MGKARAVLDGDRNARSVSVQAACPPPPAFLQGVLTACPRTTLSGRATGGRMALGVYATTDGRGSSSPHQTAWAERVEVGCRAVSYEAVGYRRDIEWARWRNPGDQT